MEIIRKGASKMTDVLTNFENIMVDYSNNIDNTEEKTTRLEFFLIVWKIKKMTKTGFARKIIKENIVRDKYVNQGRPTIKGTRITPNDIGRIIENGTNVTIEKIREEFPSIDNEEQILAGLFVFMRDRLSWKEVLFNK